ncbi:hypothetical protein AB0C14_19695 [Microbispora hainanensis]|uniref:hypothetical protein n=1 Tax=Microbispora hainanensis TaxID=568844 RepID=UPI0033E76DED
MLTDVGKPADNVGGQGLAINQPLAPAADVFGHPADPDPADPDPADPDPADPNPDGRRPYTGEKLERSTGSTFPMKVTGLPMDRPVGVDSPVHRRGLPRVPVADPVRGRQP